MSATDRDLALVQRARRGLIGVPLVMAAALTATITAEYANVRAARVAIARGQGEALLNAASRATRPGRRWGEETLEELVADAGEKIVGKGDPAVAFGLGALPGSLFVENGCSETRGVVVLETPLLHDPPPRSRHLRV